LYKLILILLLCVTAYTKDFTVASYNVENLFDLTKQKSEYKEYIPNTKSKWNQKNFNIKINNVLKVLKDIDADIIALQEIENRQILQHLQRKLPQYKYISFSKHKRSSVGIGFLSKIKIKNNKNIDVKFSNKIFRPILETTFELDNTEFKVFNNHWPSKRVAESYRLKFAKKLFDRLKQLPKDYDYILVGDFNSNYDEYKTIYKEKKLNNTSGITGINQVLNTTINRRYVTYDDVLTNKKRVNYNLWLDIDYSKRFSNKYRGRNNTPDNIIIAPALFDNKKISYVTKSFEVFRPNYLYKNKKIIRWRMKNRVHSGSGFSDHLPIIAKFSTNKEKRNIIKQIAVKEKKLNKISYLYTKQKLIDDIYLKDVVVIYKYKNSAIIKQKNDRAIYLYNNAKDLSLGFSYNLKISQIKDYYGLKEVDKFIIKKHNGKYKYYKDLHLYAHKADLFDKRFQNEIIKNLKGTYKKGYLYLKNKKIKLFMKNKKDLPKDNSKITIKKAHLGYYRNKTQIIVHDKSEIDVN
jgi:endonuclease/exonuclease/phosphatase family metal-dependent hydrolase